MKDIQAPLEQQDGENGCENDAGAAEHHRQAGTDILQAHSLKQDAHHTERPWNDQAPNVGRSLWRSVLLVRPSSVLALKNKPGFLHESIQQCLRLDTLRKAKNATLASGSQVSLLFCCLA